MRPTTYTVEQLAAAIAKSDSWRKVCAELKLCYCQDSLNRLKAKADVEKISYSHFLGRATWKGKISPLRVPALEKQSCKSHELKLALIRDGLKKHQCESCSLTEWLGKPIPITLHHVDGDKHNNELGNLQILCGNCHMQTPNYCTKNKRRYRKSACGRKGN